MTAPERLPRFRPSQLSEAQRRLYDSIVGGPRSRGNLLDEEGRLGGPFNAMLSSPEIGEPLQQLGAAIRFRSSLTDRARELAILTVAAHWKSGHERRSHEAAGTAAGLTIEEMSAVASGNTIPTASITEAAIVDVTRRLLEHWNLDDQEWNRANTALGAPILFELTVLVGYYSLLAMQMRIFNGDNEWW